MPYNVLLSGDPFSYLLYKDEKPSVRLSVLAALITFPPHHVSTSDLLEMKATSSGINKFFSKSF